MARRLKKQNGKKKTGLLNDKAQTLRGTKDRIESRFVKAYNRAVKSLCGVCVCFWKPSERPELGQKPKDKCSEVDWLTHLQCYGFMILLGFSAEYLAESLYCLALSLLLHQEVYIQFPYKSADTSSLQKCGNSKCAAKACVKYSAKLSMNLSNVFWLFDSIHSWYYPTIPRLRDI